MSAPKVVSSAGTGAGKADADQLKRDGGENPQTTHSLRRACLCGCGRPVPRQNGKYFDRKHHAAHVHATGYFSRLGKIGGKAAWAKGSKAYTKHVVHVAAQMQRLVPAQPTFTRAEVLQLVVKARRVGYQRGYTRMLMEAQREVA